MRGSQRIMYSQERSRNDLVERGRTADARGENYQSDILELMRRYGA